jgi:protein disulfide-isomerase
MPRAQDYLAQLNQIAAARSQNAPPVLAQMSATPPTNAQPPSASPSMGDGRYADYYRQRVASNGQPAPAMPGAPAQGVPAGAPYASIAAVPPGPAGAQMPAPVSPSVPAGPSSVEPNPGYAGASTPAGPSTASAPSAAAPDKVAGESGRPPIALPPGSPPLGIEGYCPVQLVDNHRWIAGDSRWGAVHQGRTYLFAGQEEQRRFLNGNADAYAPVISGMDVVLAVERHEQVPGSLHHGGYFANRVFLFSSEETLQKFSQRPEFYVQALRAPANAPYQR